MMNSATSTTMTLDVVQNTLQAQILHFTVLRACSRKKYQFVKNKNIQKWHTVHKEICILIINPTWCKANQL